MHNKAASMAEQVVCAVLSLLCFFVLCESNSFHFYVSPTGSDSNNGYAISWLCYQCDM